MWWQPNKTDQERCIVRYEAQPTRMFGSYTVTAHYADGSSQALTHGTPHYCLEEARRLNDKLATLAEDAPIKP